MYGYQSKHVEVGLSAQQVKQIMPEIIDLAPFDTEYIDGKIKSNSGENYLTLHYERLVPLIVEAIKELSNEVEKLKQEVTLIALYNK